MRDKTGHFHPGNAPKGTGKLQQTGDETVLCEQPIEKPQWIP
jgi:hypothetical protein